MWRFKLLTYASSIALVNVSICQMYCQHGFEHSTAAEAAAVTTSKWRRTQLFVGKQLIKKKQIYRPPCVAYRPHNTFL